MILQEPHERARGGIGSGRLRVVDRNELEISRPNRTIALCVPPDEWRPAGLHGETKSLEAVRRRDQVTHSDDRVVEAPDHREPPSRRCTSVSAASRQAQAGPIVKNRRSMHDHPGDHSAHEETYGKALVRRSWQELYTAGNIDAVEAVFDERCISHDPTFPEGKLEDAAAIKDNIRRGHAAFEGWRFDVDALFEDAEHVISRVTMRGKHIGEFLGIPASGADVVVSGITINRVANGRIVERWGNWDTLGMLQQLKALPRVSNVG